MWYGEEILIVIYQGSFMNETGGASSDGGNKGSSPSGGTKGSGMKIVFCL